MGGEDSTRSTSSGGAVVQLSAGIARVVDGPDRGRVATIGEQPFVIGSSDDADFVLRDRRVSRRHCEIRLVPLGFLVRDLGSHNGTIFEGSRVGEVAVPPGAILKLGRTHLALLPEGEATTLEPSTRESFGGLVGHSIAMRRLYALLERAAASDATVLLGGETGTGKEVAARALHEMGTRRGGPFEVLDCGAITPTLLGAELFGHVRGAFTGAARDRAGVFERAHGGTVFLDEIGELPLALQPALLRACYGGTIQRVGGSTVIKVDVRIIAATRRDLAAEVLAGRFREDLYYRLHVLPVVLPALRTRRTDLPELVRVLLGQLGMLEPGPIDGPPLAALQAHAWPGNVRELRNVLERALAMAPAGARFRDLTFALDGATSTPRAAGSFQDGKRAAIDRFEMEYLRDLMAEHASNVKQASRASGIERTQLKRLLRRHGIL